jgi:hypothetical protein
MLEAPLSFRAVLITACRFCDPFRVCRRAMKGPVPAAIRDLIKTAIYGDACVTMDMIVLCSMSRGLVSMRTVVESKL